MKMTKCLVAGVMVVAGALVGAPAQAVNTCSEPQRAEFETPGFNTVMQVRVCISHGSPARGAYVHVAWTDGGDSADDGDRKFDALDIHYQLNANGVAVANGSCSLADRVNRNESGTYTCETVYQESSRAGGWNADGYISYNLDRDGADILRTPLRASPIVYN